MGKPDKLEKLIMWMKNHNLLKEEVPVPLRFENWYVDANLILTCGAMLKENAADKLAEFRGGIIANAMFCWAMKQPHCDSSIHCDFCKKQGYEYNPIICVCKSCKNSYMHPLCYACTSTPKCKKCNRDMYNIEDFDGYIYGITEIIPGITASISCDDAGRRCLKCFTDKGIQYAVTKYDLISICTNKPNK